MLSCSARACVGTAVLFGTINVIAALPVAALTMKECSAKYKAEQAAGTVGGMTWQAFRKVTVVRMLPRLRQGPPARRPRRQAEMRGFQRRSTRNIQRNPRARRGCTRVSTNTTRTRPATVMAVSTGFRREAATIANATSG